jgi:hypothetical protein
MIAQGIVPGIAIPSMIKGLASNKSCGNLICRIENSEKKITFWHGRVTGAMSTLIDDRMGEVIYRKGVISVDDFVEAAGKVNHKMRFGEALVRSGVFNEQNLWDALNMQARDILASLCFYNEIHVEFVEQKNPPRGESLIQFEVDEILDDAATEASLVAMFKKHCESRPRLEIEANATSLANNDFLKDLLGLIQKNNEFDALVNKESRLSPIYTTRALFEMYAKGILKETLSLHKHVLREESLYLIKSVVENANFMFAELRAAAAAEEIEAWDTIIAFSNNSLQGSLGLGLFVKSEDGFIFENIVRACLCQTTAREWVTKFPSPNRWVDVVADAIHDILYGAVLQIMFGLQNRKADSQHFARAKAIVDKMRYPDATN